MIESFLLDHFKSSRDRSNRYTTRWKVIVGVQSHMTKLDMWAQRCRVEGPVHQVEGPAYPSPGESR